jgi:hypothetical protein
MLGLLRQVRTSDLYKAWRPRLLRLEPAEVWYEPQGWILTYAIWHPTAFEGALVFLVEEGQRLALASSALVVRDMPNSSPRVIEAMSADPERRRLAASPFAS